MGAQRSWRDLFDVHPATDVFPMMSDEELADLAEDIKQNGLRTPVRLWDEIYGDEDDVQTKTWLLDGRNRLEALERAGMCIPTFGEAMSDRHGGRLRQSFDYGEPWNDIFGGKYGQALYDEAAYVGPRITGRETDPAALVIGFNIKRRHLSQAEKARLALKALEAARGHRRTSGGDRHAKGLRGSSKGETGLAADLAGVSKDVAREQAAVRADPDLDAKVEKGETTPIEAGREIRERKKGQSHSPRWEAIKENADKIEKYREDVLGPRTTSEAEMDVVKRNRETVRKHLARPRQSSGADQAERDLRKWAERYEAEAHAALHKVFPEWVTAPSADRKRKGKDGAG